MAGCEGARGGGGAGQGSGGFLVSVGLRLLGVALGDLDTPLPSEGDDVGPEPCVGGEDAVVAVAVDPGRRDQTGDGLEELAITTE